MRDAAGGGVHGQVHAADEEAGSERVARAGDVHDRPAHRTTVVGAPVDHERRTAGAVLEHQYGGAAGAEAAVVRRPLGIVAEHHGRAQRRADLGETRAPEAVQHRGGGEVHRDPGAVGPGHRRGLHDPLRVRCPHQRVAGHEQPGRRLQPGAEPHRVQPAQVARVGGHRPRAVTEDREDRAHPSGRGTPDLDAASGEGLLHQCARARVRTRSEDPGPAPERDHPGRHVRGLPAGRERDGRRRVVVGRQRLLGLDDDVEHDVSQARHQHRHASRLRLRHNAAMTAPLPGPPLVLADEVSDAIASHRPVVALESTIISHGLPTSTSAATAREIEDAVRRGGAVPATVAVVDGAVRVGLSDEELMRVAEDDDVVKTSIRDLGPVLARGVTGATTVAATSLLAHRAGIALFATGGLGGVHRGARDSWDESADLLALASVPVTVVCAGAKSILDVPATLERLETLSVTVLGYGTDTFPGFYVRDSGEPVPWRVDSPEEVAAVVAQQRSLGLRHGTVVAQPVAVEHEMDRALHDETLREGLLAASDAGVTGKETTPYLPAWFHHNTRGASLAANVALVLANAGLAARIAAALARLESVHT